MEKINVNSLKMPKGTSLKQWEGLGYSENAADLLNLIVSHLKDSQDEVEAKAQLDELNNFLTEYSAERRTGWEKLKDLQEEYDAYLKDFRDAIAADAADFTAKKFEVDLLVMGKAFMTFSEILSSFQKLYYSSDIAHMQASNCFSEGPCTVFSAFDAIARRLVIARGTHGDVEFVADNPGTDGNSISLVFDGTDTIADVVSAWNTANASNSVTAVTDDDTQVLAATTLNLSGGNKLL